MEIVVNDTNILIDLYNAGLLPYCKNLKIDFRTLDVIMNEIEDETQLKAISHLIEEGTLRVYALTSEQVEMVYQKIIEYQYNCNLSAEDISVMIYAKENKCRLLTGDKTLRTKATLENIKVSGILYLIDLLTKEQIISKQELITSLENLLKTNNRLPRKLIIERIDLLKL